MPPAQAPAQPDPTFDPFRAALQAYIDQTQQYRRTAAENQEKEPGKRPRKGITHFVSGGGGRYLYRFRPSEFDAIGISEHHLMIVQISGDTMLFEAISHGQKVIDCGAVYRTQTAAEKTDDHTKTWLEECDAAKPRAITTTAGRR